MSGRQADGKHSGRDARLGGPSDPFLYIFEHELNRVKELA